MMIFLNIATKKGTVTNDTACKFVQILSPFAPHLAEELWSLLGKKEILTFKAWPEVNEELLKEDVVEYPVSFNGKLRFRISLPVNMGKEEIIKTVMADERAKKWIETGTVTNVIVVPERIVNVVIKTDTE